MTTNSLRVGAEKSVIKLRKEAISLKYNLNDVISALSLLDFDEISKDNERIDEIAEMMADISSDARDLSCKTYDLCGYRDDYYSEQKAMHG